MSTFLQEFQKTARAAGFPWAESNFSDGSDSTALVKDLLNEANELHSQLAPAKIVDLTIATVDGTTQYTLPADFSRMIDLYYYRGTRKIRIEKQTEDAFLTLESVVSSSIQFLYYIIRPTTDVSGNVINQLWLYPTPIGTSAVYAKYHATSPVLDTDPSSVGNKTTVMVAPVGYGYLNVYWALSNIFDMREQAQEANQFQKKYDDLYKKYITRVKNLNDDPVIKMGLRTQINPNYYPTLF